MSKTDQLRALREAKFAKRTVKLKGAIPDGMQVLHKCDTPRCCNPEHLWLGTHQDNVDDKMRKGRHVPGRTNKRRGESNGNSRLTEKMVKHIRQREMTYVEYARLYGVSKSVICQVASGKTWQHVAA